jgi:hypothetical protein
MNILKTSLSIAIVCSLAACTKRDVADTASISQTQSDNLTFPVTNEFSGCKIRRIYHADPYSDQVVSGLFTYNAAGNPYSVTYDHVGTGNQNHYFYYDKLGRLKEYHQRYSPNDPVEEMRHVYGYDANNRITTDSLLNTWGGVFRVSTLTYDSLGRIVKESTKDLSNMSAPARVMTYTYDARGNLAVAGWKSSSYDYNKVSIFRSHPVFQFIFRNYSRNNAAAQAKYNSKGLPLSMNPGNDMFFNSSTITKAVYDCK